MIGLHQMKPGNQIMKVSWDTILNQIILEGWKIKVAQGTVLNPQVRA